MAQQLTFPDLDFLLYVYNHMSTAEKIAYQANFPNTVPEQFKILPCQSCNSQVGQLCCSVCQIPICKLCTFHCPDNKKIYCPTHYSYCPVCKYNCACVDCRQYLQNNICDVCADRSERYDFYSAFSCGCINIEEEEEVSRQTKKSKTKSKTKKKQCVYCFRKIDINQNREDG